MKALITGAAGFTGGRLSRRLSKDGIDVRVLVRDKSKLSISSQFDPEIVEGDIRDEEAVARAVKGVEKVFHVAAMYRTAGIPDSVYWDVHVRGTENLLNASIRHNIKCFVHCSTVGVHGHIEKGPASENYRFNPGDIYQSTKLEGELKALEFNEKYGLPVSVIRPCAIYGPGDMRLYKLFKLASKRVVPVLGSGKVIYHMVYIDDLVNAFILSSEKEEAIGQSFIIGGDERLSLIELIERIAKIVGNNPFKVFLPAKPFQMLGSICEKICTPLGIEPPIYRRRVDFFTKSRSFDIGKAASVLGYSPSVCIEKGLVETMRWYQSQGLLPKV